MTSGRNPMLSEIVTFAAVRSTNRKAQGPDGGVANGTSLSVIGSYPLI